MIKTYKIDNYEFFRIVFTIGKSKVICEFEDGNKHEKIPSRYTTDNALIQHLIESDDKFGGLIKLDSSKESPLDLILALKPEVLDKATHSPYNNDVAPKVFEDATSQKGVIDILVSEGYIKKSGEIKTDEDIVKLMVQHNLSFPNCIAISRIVDENN